MSDPLDLSYLVPIRWHDGEQRDEMGAYLAAIAPHCAEVIVVDGSPPAVFAANAEAWGRLAIHVPPAAEERCLMGKVSGVRTGVRLASCERLVIADDDVRYEAEGLRRTARLLDEHDLVRPQNYLPGCPGTPAGTRRGPSSTAASAATIPAPWRCGARGCWRWASTTATSSSRTWS